MSKELDTLAPSPVMVSVAGEEVAILPLRIGQLPAFLRAIKPAYGYAAAHSDAIPWIELFADHGDSLLEAITIACGKPRGWADALMLDEAIALAVAIIQVNADFFAQRVGPKIGEISAVLPSVTTPKKAKVGST